jgi:hypothetical protein
MAELPIKTYKLLSSPELGPGSLDGYRWRVWLEEDVPLMVDLSRTQAVVAGLSRGQLEEGLPAALQRLASERLRNDLPVLDQVLGWNSPVVLKAHHFD